MKLEDKTEEETKLLSPKAARLMYMEGDIKKYWALYGDVWLGADSMHMSHTFPFGPSFPVAYSTLRSSKINFLEKSP